MRPKFDDGLKAVLGASWMVVLLVIVDILSVVETLTLGQSQISGTDLTIFNLGALIVVVGFGGRANLDKLGALFTLLARSTRIGIVESRGVIDGHKPGEGRLRRILENLWIPVTFQFMLVGWLVYASGGLVNSPYSQVPIVMMVIGQSVYDTPPVDSSAGAKPSGVLFSIRGIARHYTYPMLMLMFLLLGLVTLQAAHPLVKRPAPDIEMVFTTLVNLFVSMCVVFVTRRADQTMAPRSRAFSGGPQARTPSS